MEIVLEKLRTESVTVWGAVGAELYVNNVPVGKLPTTLKMQEGVHLFRAETNSGSKCEVSREITFSGAEPPRVQLDC